MDLNKTPATSDYSLVKGDGMFKKKKDYRTNWTSQYQDTLDKLKNGPVKIIKLAREGRPGY